jgi:excisionase family DNA binding protein
VIDTGVAEAIHGAIEDIEDASDVLDVPRVARLLDVGRNTIYSLVAKNQIPHRRLGKQIRFSRAAVVQWLSWSWQGAKEGK